MRKPAGRQTELLSLLPVAGRSTGKETDALDDLLNRSLFCQHVRNRMAEWNRGGAIFSVLLAKVSSRVQDTEVGDPPQELPRQAAVLVTAVVREMDLVGIYNPDCLAVLLPSAPLSDAIRVAQRFQEAFLQVRGSAQQHERRLTLSIGMAEVEKGDNFLTLLKRAEETLEAADREGGDSSYCHDGEQCVPMSEILEKMECAV